MMCRRKRWMRTSDGRSRGEGENEFTAKRVRRDEGNVLMSKRTAVSGACQQTDGETSWCDVKMETCSSTG